MDFSLVELAAPRSFHGKSLADLGLRRRHRVMVVATKSGDHHELVPGATYVVKPSDVLVLIGRNADLEALASGEQ